MAENEYMTTNNHLSNSDESDNDFDGETIPELRGYLSKWTNYIHGWQPRFIVLKDGTLSYYKSEQESDLGCRGAISLQKATVKVSFFVYLLFLDFIYPKRHDLHELQIFELSITHQ